MTEIKKETMIKYAESIKKNIKMGLFIDAYKEIKFLLIILRADN